MTYEWMGLVPFAHQLECFEKSKSLRAYAYLMEQGTGKTKVVCDKTIHLFNLNKIDALVIVAPNGVHRNWIEREVPLHFAKVPYVALLWQHNHTKAFKAEMEVMLKMEPSQDKRKVRIIAANIESFQRKDSDIEKFLRRFMAKFRTHMAVDESSGIKTNGAKRTKRLILIGRNAEARAILSGTSVTQGPFDLYPQFQFLKNGALGFDTYTTFKAYYAEWRDKVIPGGRIDPRTGKMPTFKDLVRYKNLEELKQRVGAMSYTKLKKDCLDLPDKVYEPPRFCEPTVDMRRIYNDALHKILVEIEEDRTLTIRNVLTRMLRLGQITGGFVPDDVTREAQPIPGGNVKLDGLLGILEELRPEAKVIIWARFLPELRLITKTLAQTYPGGVSRWWGDVKEEVRGLELDAFMQNPERRFFVGQQHSGGFGLTLTAASHVIYFSNDFSYEARAQSEDRAHRIGQKNQVTYWDLVVPRSIDEKLLKVLTMKKEMADYFKTPADVGAWVA